MRATGISASTGIRSPRQGHPADQAPEAFSTHLRGPRIELPQPCAIMALKSTTDAVDGLGFHSAAGVTHVLSILDPGWPEPEAFNAFAPHRRLELRFHDVIEA